ncbi:hypothetical protein [Clostridium sp. ZBS12]|uniref:hypothetical protein n=1 Tax=Clostridium sp. ZBS12 TaxID=2949972 RepID=UPI002079AFAF|nr:hypothetical protein [Clostridium sp. ZBS12]
MIYVIDKDEIFYEIMKELNLLGGIISNNRVKFFFGDEYKKVNLDNYIIYNNENTTQIHTDFYYKVIKYFTSQSQCNVKKKIAFYEHVTIADDCIDDFKNLGFDVMKLNFSTKDKIIQDLINVNSDYIFQSI